ncbi:MAG: hypothetical protein ABSF53_22265 [Terracidiphilus sp.]
MQTQSDFFEAYYNLGVIYTKEKRANDAINAWHNVVRIRPAFAQGHESLGYLLYAQSKYSDAITELRLAVGEEPNRVFALNLTASLLATCPDSSVRNGPEALSLAERAEQLTDGKDPGILDTLAAAYAENGSFARAIEVEQQALELAAKQGDAGLETRIKVHLSRYASNEPLRVAPSQAAL